MSRLHKGDRIRCADTQDLIDTMYDLEANGYEVDFDFRREGELWLRVEKVKWWAILEDLLTRLHK